ncbi:hypothetical protein M9458_037103, partial [Cirrhinus mrigala]
SSCELRAEYLCLEKGGQSWLEDPTPWLFLNLILELSEEDEELSAFIRSTAAYDT